MSGTSEGPEKADPLGAAHTGAQTAKPARKPQAKSTRRRARELALQGLYQWLVSGADGADRCWPLTCFSFAARASGIDSGPPRFP